MLPPKKQHEYLQVQWNRNAQQNTSKSNPRLYKKDNISWSVGAFPELKISWIFKKINVRHHINRIRW